MAIRRYRSIRRASNVSKEKEITVHAMWPKYIKGIATGQVYGFEMGHYAAACFRLLGDASGGPPAIFCYNNFMKEGKSRKPVVVACDERGNQLPVEFFFTTEEK
jgi:hypothetical protein